MGKKSLKKRKSTRRTSTKLKLVKKKNRLVKKNHLQAKKNHLRVKEKKKKKKSLLNTNMKLLSTNRNMKPKALNKNQLPPLLLQRLPLLSLRSQPNPLRLPKLLPLLLHQHKRVLLCKLKSAKCCNTANKNTNGHRNASWPSSLARLRCAGHLHDARQRERRQRSRCAERRVGRCGAGARVCARCHGRLVRSNLGRSLQSGRHCHVHHHASSQLGRWSHLHCCAMRRRRLGRCAHLGLVARTFD